MIIGTDVSLRICKEEGYLIMKYDARQKFTHNTQVKFIEYLPEDVRREMGIKGLGRPKTTWLTVNDLWEDYERHKAGIQSCCDYHVESILEIKDYWQMLFLADSINAYNGIFD